MGDDWLLLPGLSVGHWTDLEGGTGCTVVLCEAGAVAGVDVRGAAPGTRETDLLRPGNLVERVHAVVLAGGSAFGLDAAGGVMRYLEERGVGFPTMGGVVPIVPAAVLYDLTFGRADRRPDAQAGYAACLAATEQPAQGSVGAGTGATVAKLHGPAAARKGGFGVGRATLPDGHRVVALFAVNAVGAIYNPAHGEPVAIPRQDESDSPPERVATLLGSTNTTIGVVATTAPLDKAGATRLATTAHDGLALAIRPSHTLYDGDTIFTLSLPPANAAPADPLALARAATDATVQAVLNAVRLAVTLHSVPGIASDPNS